jgi:hypothetical protein
MSDPFWMGVLFTFASIGAVSVVVLCLFFAWLLLVIYMR